MRRRAPSLALLCALTGLLVSGLSGCLNTTPPGAFFATTPPGARVRIDGRDSGFVTPCMVAVDGGRVRVDLELTGYAPARIVLAPHDEMHGIDWTFGAPAPDGFLRAPFFIDVVDLFLPFRPDDGPHPQRVHVRLRPADG